jgi:hypothetical protein
MKLNELKHVSASQISTYQRCPRKHWLEKIAGVQVPTSAGAEFGSRCHALVEKRIETGQWPDDPDAVKIAMAGWKFIPQGTPLLVEQEMRLEDAKLPIIGRIDLVVPEHSVIIDHKFLGTLRFAKTPAQLADDPQAILYCMWGWRTGHLRADGLTFRHITYQTRDNPQAVTSQHKFTPSELGEKYARTRTTIERMAMHAAMTEEGEVPAAIDSDDPSPCKAYGGCPHLARCRALGNKSVWALDKSKKEETVNVLEALAKKKKAQGIEDVGAINPPESKPVAPVAQVAQPDLFDTKALDAQPAPVTPPRPPELDMVLDPLQLSTLYVGCLPCNEAYTMLDMWIAPLQAEAAQSMGVDYYAQAEYGKGKSALAALIVHKAKLGLPLVMVVDPRLPASDVALEILRPLYQRVIVRFG